MAENGNGSGNGNGSARSAAVMRVQQAIVTGVATAGALWLFHTVQQNREDLVRVEAFQEAQGTSIREIHDDIKAMRSDMELEHATDPRAAARR